ncbi:MAG TPA: hypothetical protein VIC71_03835 [Gammaproteobacteria bacterium]
MEHAFTRLTWQLLLSFHAVMRVVVLLVTAIVVAGCAGRSAPDAVPAPAAAATGEEPAEAETETVQASTLVDDEQACKMRRVTGSIIPQRVCKDSDTGLIEADNEKEVRDTLQEIERQHTTGGLVIR